MARCPPALAPLQPLSLGLDGDGGPDHPPHGPLQHPFSPQYTGFPEARAGREPQKPMGVGVGVPGSMWEALLFSVEVGDGGGVALELE